MKKPQLKPHFRVGIIEPKHVYLLSETATHVLTGALYCQILPLLNGQHTYAALVQKLNGQVSPEHLDFVLDRLHEKGYLTDADHGLSPEMAAFWSGLGIDLAIKAAQLTFLSVRVKTVGRVDLQLLVEALGAIGVTVGEEGETGRRGGKGNSFTSGRVDG